MPPAGERPREVSDRPDIDEFMRTVQTDVRHDLGDNFLPGVHRAFRQEYAYALLDESAGRLRPALVRGTAEAFDCDGPAVRQLSRAIELVHGASLIVDDSPVHDNSSLRRGRPAFHVEFGADKAVNTSIAMLASAFYEFSAIEDAGGELVQYASRKIGDRGMCLGQAMDLAGFGEDGEPVTLAKLDDTAVKKTGSAFEIAVVGVAIMRRAQPGIMSALEDYSRLLGIAFQVKDDLLDEGDGRGKNSYLEHLGEQGARQHFDGCSAMAGEALDGLPDGLDTARLREIIAYVGRQLAGH